MKMFVLNSIVMLVLLLVVTVSASRLDVVRELKKDRIHKGKKRKNIKKMTKVKKYKPSASPLKKPSLEPSKKPSEQPIALPSASPSFSPSSKPTSCHYITPDDLLKTLSKVSTLQALTTNGTPQNKAYLWLYTSDSLYCYNDPKVIWTNGGQLSDCITSKFKKTGTERWLSTVSECAWCGASCNENNCITTINLDLVNQSGTIPYELQNLTILETLAFQRGNIQGTIPSTFGNLKEMKVLDLNCNNITGNISDSIYNIPSLEQLILSDNDLTGTISAKIVNLPNLFTLRLGNDFPYGRNAFKGTIPSVVGTLNKMKVFTVNNNKLEGTLPSLTLLTSLVFLDVSKNKFSGPIDSTNWGNKPDFFNVDLSDNKLSGTIPSSFGEAKNLIYAAFDNNDFTGSMPPAVCNNRAGFLKNLTADCAGPNPQVTCAFPTCCTGCFGN